jgi:hypothetical protein
MSSCVLEDRIVRGCWKMCRFTHIVEDEQTNEVFVKERLNEIIPDLEHFTKDLPEGRTYSLTIIDNFKNETTYYVK